MQCAAWPNFLVTHCILTATTKLPETTVHDTLTDNAFLFKMHTLRICKYFWRLSLCRIFQTDVKRRDVLRCEEFGNYTDVFFNSCFMCMICLWSSGRYDNQKGIQNILRNHFPLMCILSGDWCYSRVNTEPLSRFKSKHFIKFAATVTCHIVFRSRCHYLMWRKLKNKHISIHLGSAIWI